MLGAQSRSRVAGFPRRQAGPGRSAAARCGVRHGCVTLYRCLVAMSQSLLDSTDVTDDALTDRVRVFQRRRGHRYSVDDVATAWVAIRARPEASACLDLGCGLGSVSLMLADRLPLSRVVGIEAQAVSFALAQRNIERNGLAERVTVHLGDLRDGALIERLLSQRPGGFELVTGTPPYKPPGSATPSPDSQRAHARVELRGGVEVYLEAAVRALGPAGLFVMCAQAELAARVRAGAAAVGLRVVSRVDVVPRAGRTGQLFSVYGFVRAVSGAGSASEPLIEQLVLRDADGTRSEAARALRGFFGLQSNPDEPVSLARASLRVGAATAG